MLFSRITYNIDIILIFTVFTVRPYKWELTGYDVPVLEGTALYLLCRVKGARPAANITWFNGTEVISPQPPSNLAVQVNIYAKLLQN